MRSLRALIDKDMSMPGYAIRTRPRAMHVQPLCLHHQRVMHVGLCMVEARKTGRLC